MALLPSIHIHVEMESAELLRDIIAFLNDTIDASGPRDGTVEATSLRNRLDDAVEAGTLRIVSAETNQEAAGTGLESVGGTQ